MKVIKKKIENIPMYLPLEDHGIGKRLHLHGGREWAFMWILRTEAEGVAYDIGANIGYCTLSLAKRCQKVIALEPDPRSLKYLKKNVKLNKLENVEIVPKAVTSKVSTVNIYLDRKPNLSRVMPEDMAAVPTRGHGVFVDGVTINALATVQLPTFIKMDIEGSETNAIAGGLNTLRNAEKIKILIEVHPQFYNKENDFRHYLQVLLDNGYYFKYVVNAKGKIREFTDKGFVPFKTFKQFDKRAVFKDVPSELVLPWATEMPKDGKKVIRSVLLCKNT